MQAHDDRNAASVDRAIPAASPAHGERTRVVEQAASERSRSVFENKHIRVMCTRHTWYVASLFSEALATWGYLVAVDLEFIDRPDTGYVVVCPQMFDRLPRRYIAFQMEQSVTNRWFTPEYMETLRAAEVVFDYAPENLRYLSEAGFATGQLFYLPITPKTETANAGLAAPRAPTPTYDFAFYGDPSAPRRAALLTALEREFRVLVLTDVFGAELERQLTQARAVVNIHYYEEALLETTRMSEAISWGFPILSEDVHNAETRGLFQCERVVFFEQGDATDMVAKARLLLQRLDEETPNASSVPGGDHPRFSDYLERYLLFKERIPLRWLGSRFFPARARPESFPRFCLSLPETPARRRAFLASETHGFHIFEGVRANPGWIGCALSYQFMAREALRTSAEYITVCEDDVVFPDDFAGRFGEIENWLRDNPGRWHIFSGLIADLNEGVEILDVTTAAGITLVTVSKMTSMVFNTYSREALKLLAAWNENDRNVEKNTIDRYLEHTANLRTVVAIPYLVGHAEDLHSTLWGFQNRHYREMISRSETRLRERVEEFLQKRSRDASPSRILG